ncbi:MAG: N-6 DNA methylase [Deltaproteobacteria bacterium]
MSLHVGSALVYVSAMHEGRQPAASTKMALRRFALEAAGGIRGRNAGATFAERLIRCFGLVDDDGAFDFRHEFGIVAAGKKARRTVAAYGSERRVVVDVVDRELLLDLAWGELYRACVQMDAEPQYVVLTNQRDVRLYDLANDRHAPRLTLALDELPKYSEAFPFFAPDWIPGTTPKIINVDKVSKEVADLVAHVYRALAAENPERRDDAIRFTLRCIVAMFAEDIGLLPKEYFTALLYQAGVDGDAEAKLGELFRWMNTPRAERDEESKSIPYFNGGLFEGATDLALNDAVLRALTKAAEANWIHVDPHIFGSVFQGVMDDAERHAQGAHYTARDDIMSVVGPTIVEPWRERIGAAKTLEQLKTILKDMRTYRVLDPACGSGNFLYVAFRELYRLETEVLVRIYEAFPSATSGKGAVTWDSRIETTNFFGIDINPFAVELAKTTLNIAKKIAFEQRKEEVLAKFGQFPIEVDPSLPLDNLDENIVCADALFTDWPEADAIVGNPPFLGSQKARQELGREYLARLRERYGTINVDLCTHWFRRAHDRLADTGRAGLIGTSGIRVGRANEMSLEYIVNAGGTITDAVSSRAWGGAAVLNVSIVNWTLQSREGPFRLQVADRIYEVDAVGPELRIQPDLKGARTLRSNAEGTALGVILGSSDFVVTGETLRGAADDGVARPIATGGDMLGGKLVSQPGYCAWLADSSTEELARSASPTAARHLRAHVYPMIEARASNPKSTKHYAGWLRRWWMPRDPSARYFEFVRRRGVDARHVVCASPQTRPIFTFISTKFVPTNTLQLFAYEDDYSFGIIQSSLHWAWTKAKGGRLKSDIRYTSKVWKTFPWPQEPTLDDVIAVGQAAQQLRATRRELMDANGWSLRELYRSAEVAGPHPLKDAQAKLDAAVEAAYGKPADQEATEFLLEMNLALAEDEAAGEAIQGPGLPLVDGEALDPQDPRWFSTDCIEPPPLPGPR